MDNLLHIYFDFLGNFIHTFLVFRFAEINFKQKIQTKAKITLLCIDFIYSTYSWKISVSHTPQHHYRAAISPLYLTSSS